MLGGAKTVHRHTHTHTHTQTQRQTHTETDTHTDTFLGYGVIRNRKKKSKLNFFKIAILPSLVMSLEIKNDTVRNVNWAKFWVDLLIQLWNY